MISHINIRSGDTRYNIQKNNNNTNITFMNIYRKKQLLTLILQQRHNYLKTIHNNIIKDNNRSTHLSSELSQVQDTPLDILTGDNIYEDDNRVEHDNSVEDDNRVELEITNIIIGDFIKHYNIYNSPSISNYSQDVEDTDVENIIEYIVDEKIFIENEVLYENIYKEKTSHDEVSIMTDVSLLINNK